MCWHVCALHNWSLTCTECKLPVIACISRVNALESAELRALSHKVLRSDLMHLVSLQLISQTHVSLHALHLSSGLCERSYDLTKASKVQFLKRVFCFPLEWITCTRSSSSGPQRPSTANTAADRTSSGSTRSVWSTLFSVVLHPNNGRSSLWNRRRSGVRASAAPQTLNLMTCCPF